MSIGRHSLYLDHHIKYNQWNKVKIIEKLARTKNKIFPYKLNRQLVLLHFRQYGNFKNLTSVRNFCSDFILSQNQMSKG